MESGLYYGIEAGLSAPAVTFGFGELLLYNSRLSPPRYNYPGYESKLFNSIPIYHDGT